MDYFSKFLRTAVQPSPKTIIDHSQEFHNSWNSVKNTLLMPDERQLTKGIASTDVPALLQSMVDSLVWEYSRIEAGGTGACLEYLLKNDVLGTLVRLSEHDRPSGIQAEVLKAVSNMVVLLDEQFLVHSVVHKAVLRLLRNCVGDDLQEQLDGRSKLMGAARGVVRSQPSEHEEDLVNLLCILCSRIRTYRELLMIFFHDKHWYRSEPLFAVEEEDEEDEVGAIYRSSDEDEEDDEEDDPDSTLTGPKIHPSTQTEVAPPSPTFSHKTITSNQPPQEENKKPEYEFLLFNYLLRFVHREGHIGEYARAGVLFLMDVAMSTGELDNRTSEEQDPSVTDPVNDAALALAEYILDGDFSEVLGAGLVAVYSALPSKLAFFPPTLPPGQENAMTIGGSVLADEDEKERIAVLREKTRLMGLEDARSPEFQSKMDHFLTLLMFLQDVLRRNVSHENVDASAVVGTAIVQSILDAVHRIFLENVFYPSILECSDADGSAVAVMSYIEIMIRTLRAGPLMDLLIDFLASEDNDDPRYKQRAPAMAIVSSHEVPPTSEEQRKKNRRRQSSAMTLLELEAPESRKPSDYFTSMGRFTLKDLLLSNLKSKSQETAISALQLFQTMLTIHPQFTIERILLVIPDSSATAYPRPAIVEISYRSGTPAKSDEDDEEFRYTGIGASKEDSDPSYSDRSMLSHPYITYSTHEREMDLYLALVSRIDPSHSDDADNFSTGYDHYLRDALVTIQSQPVYFHALEDSENDPPRYKHRLNLNDRIISSVLDALTNFFSNTPNFNIGLTHVLATLATHPYRSVAGWITFGINGDSSLPDRYALYGRHAADGDGDDRSIDSSIEEKLANDTNFLPAASMDENSRPVVYAIFQALVNQLERYRQSVENFDKFLLERKQGLLFSENLTDALNLALDITDEPKPITAISEAAPAPKPKAKPSTSSSLVSFLTPKKSKPLKSPLPPPEPTTLASKTIPTKVSASPFGSHYQQTGSVKVEPFAIYIPSSVAWTPSRSISSSIHDEDVFGSPWGDKPANTKKDEDDSGSIAPVTLSQLLDNAVILEESIKEIVAIIHARRSLGIDSLHCV